MLNIRKTCLPFSGFFKFRTNHLWQHLALSFALVLNGCALSENNRVPILQLVQLVDDVPTNTLSVMSDQIDPNVYSSSTSTTVVLNGKEIEGLSAQYAIEIAQRRRLYSYDTFTGGIEDKTSFVTCRLGGPSIGWTLKTRYVVYNDSHQITEDSLRTVLTEAGNCLFTTDIQPKERTSHVAAAKALAQLQAILNSETNTRAYTAEHHPCNSGYMKTGCED